MKRDESEKLERVEELLGRLQKNFVETYKEIHELISSVSDDDDWDANDEVDDNLVDHMEEIFGEEEEE